MSRAIRTTRRRSSLSCLVLVVSLLACAGAARAATPFQRGDVFVLGTAGVKEYSPSGALRQTMAGTANATAICVDPSGRHLILPGAGLFDRSGQSVASRWASVTNRARCVADGFGHV